MLAGLDLTWHARTMCLTLTEPAAAGGRTKRPSTRRRRSRTFYGHKDPTRHWNRSKNWQGNRRKQLGSRTLHVRCLTRRLGSKGILGESRGHRIEPRAQTAPKPWLSDRAGCPCQPSERVAQIVRERHRGEHHRNSPTLRTSRRSLHARQRRPDRSGSGYQKSTGGCFKTPIRVSSTRETA